MATPSVAPQPSAMPRRRNPLHRRADSLRSWLRVLFVVSIGIAVALTVLLGLQLYSNSRASAQRAQVGLHEVSTVATTDPSTAGVGTWVATLTWTDASGPHTVQAPVPVATVPGDDVSLWVNAKDVPQPQPIPAVQSAGSAATYALAAFAAGTTLLAGGYALARHSLDRRTWRAWEEEWARVEPDWTHRS
ncbi:hypothetical protein [Streptacidiphilus sp. MAP5-3]|uniref:Rv1733c family protein n=1 Tax=unclassified Streptacidiphilus TaxID=2643834 RepID=UPI003516A243